MLVVTSIYLRFDNTQKIRQKKVNLLIKKYFKREQYFFATVENSHLVALPNRLEIEKEKITSGKLV